MSDLKNVFSSKLKELRIKKGYTQTQMAEKLDVTQGAYQKWESGTREPNLENIGKLSKILGVSIDFLLSNDSIIEYYRKIFSANPKVTDDIESKIINDLDIYIDKLDNQIYNTIALTIYKEATTEEVGNFLGKIIFHYKKLFEIENFIKTRVKQFANTDEEKEKMLKIIDSSIKREKESWK